ncbi:MAG: DUF819 family protein [Pseudomonadota bacterium]
MTIALLSALVAASLWVQKVPTLRWASPAIVVLLGAAVLSNLGVLPRSADTPVYGVIYGPVLSVSVFLLVSQVSLRDLAKAGPHALILFVVGALGVSLGAITGANIPLISSELGEAQSKIAAVFTGTYIGGGVNFATLASVERLTDDPTLFAAAVAVDNLFTVLWLALTLAVAPVVTRRLVSSNRPPDEQDSAVSAAGTSLISMEMLALVCAVGALALVLAEALHGSLGLGHPLVWLTLIALVIAQTPLQQASKALEGFALILLLIFVAALGAEISIDALVGSGSVAAAAAVLVLIILVVHSVTVLAAAKLLRIDGGMTLVISQGLIGGPPTAIAVAEAIDRPDLRVPGVAVSLLGYAVGTFVGLFVAGALSR